MPELPEMENYRILLSRLVVNKPISNVEIGREKSINVPADYFINELKGHSIKRITRRAKHLLFYLDTNKILLLHLMLGGWMFYGNEDEKPERTIQIKISFGDRQLYFIGLRLGYLHLLSEDQAEDELHKLGPEPLEQSFTISQFQKMIGKKRGTLKTTLTDQGFISGIGNYYSDEVCFHAKLLPSRKGNELTETEINNLFHGIQHVLKEATKFGGYMESPLYAGDQLTGSYDKKCKVYDRESELCFRCGNPIIKNIISSKKTFFCKICQH